MYFLERLKEVMKIQGKSFRWILFLESTSDRSTIPFSEAEAMENSEDKVPDSKLTTNSRMEEDEAKVRNAGGQVLVDVEEFRIPGIERSANCARPIILQTICLTTYPIVGFSMSMIERKSLRH